MYTYISDELRAALDGNARHLLARIELLDGSGTVTDGFRKISITTGRTGMVNFGDTLAKTVTVEMDDAAIAIQGKEFRLDIGMELPDGTIEYVPMGKYQAERPRRKKGILTLTGYDALVYKCEVLYDAGISFPASDLDVLRDICSQIGVRFQVEDESKRLLINESGAFLIDEAGARLYVIESGLGDYIFSEAPEGFTVREMISYISSMHGYFAGMGRNGDIVLAWYSDTYLVSADRFAEPELGEHDVLLGELHCAIDDGRIYSYATGIYGSSVEFENPFMTQSMLDRLMDERKGFRHRLGSVLQILGDPCLDPWDVLLINVNGEQVRMPCGSIEMQYDGGLSCSISAGSEDADGDNYSCESPSNKRFRKVEEKIRRNNRAQEEAIKHATELITGATGGYVIIDQADDGKPARILIMDNADAEKAVNVIQLNRAGIGFSTSGIAGPYRNAWTIDGHLVADFITAGKLTSGTVGGWTISENRIRKENIINVNGEDWLYQVVLQSVDDDENTRNFLYVRRRKPSDPDGYEYYEYLISLSKYGTIEMPKTMQSGTVIVKPGADGAPGSVNVSFRPEMARAPRVTVTARSQNPGSVSCSISDVTADGFILWIARTDGQVETSVDWIAAVS